MAADARAFDGHTVVFSQDCGIDPSTLDQTTVAKAVNRSFRGGRNRTRPPFIHRPFVFTDPQDEAIVKKANLQGAVFYRKTRVAREDCLVASIGGYFFRFTLVNDKFVVDRIFHQNNPLLMHTWFVQAQDWLYAQNGLESPIFWDGTMPSSARRSGFPDNQEMPIGTIMQYAFGRVFVASSYDQVIASDIIYGKGFNNTNNTQNFTENTYANEGGSFGMPMTLGHITGMLVSSFQSKGNLFGQGLLMVFGEEGAQGLDVSVSREGWKDAQIQSVTLTGIGCIAHNSLINVNNQMVFRSDDGLSVYQMAQSDENTQFAFGKFSQPVNFWFDQDTDWLKQFNSTIHFDNRILSTVSPTIQPPEDPQYGNHRYHRGMVVLDLDRTVESQSGRSIAWNGLWTGIRPTALINGRFGDRKRAFAFSFDADGQNRIYEICTSGRFDEVEGIQVPCGWAYETRKMDWSAVGTSNSFEMKKIVGGELHVSEMSDRIQIEAQYRSDNRPDWRQLSNATDIGPALTGFKFTEPRAKRIKFLTPSDRCLPGEPNSAAHGLQHQVKIKGVGSVRVDRVRVSMSPGGNDPNVPVGDDPSKLDDPEAIVPTSGPLENDYEYLIMPSPSS